MINQIGVNTIPKVFSRYSGKLAKSGVQIFGHETLAVTAPKGADSYTYIGGTGKKGNFEHFSFRNAAGKAVRNFTRYTSQNGEIKDVTTDYETNHKYHLNAVRKIIKNGKETVEYISIMVPIQQNNPKQNIFSKSFMISDENGQRGGFEGMRMGKKPVGISFNYNWDGTPADIVYKNTEGKKLELSDEETRYLPFAIRKYSKVINNGTPILVTTDFTDKHVQNKIDLVQIIQEKLHDIEGIMPRAKAVKFKDLHLVKTSGRTPEEMLHSEFYPMAETLGNGQINLAADLAELVPNIPDPTDGFVILDKIAHEMQHSADYIAMYRGGDEAAKEAQQNLGINGDEWEKAHEYELKDIMDSIKEYRERIIAKKGAAVKGTPEYDNAVKLCEMNYTTTAVKDLKTQAEHDEMPLEKRAIEREIQQANFYIAVCKKMSDFVTDFLQ